MQHMVRLHYSAHTPKPAQELHSLALVQKITPVKLAQSYVNIRRHYTTPHDGKIFSGVAGLYNSLMLSSRASDTHPRAHDFD